MPGFSGRQVIDSPKENDSALDVGNEEVERFFEDVDNVDPILVESPYQCNCDIKSIIRNAKNELESSFSRVSTILCHRKKRKFWDILFRQKVDLATSSINVIWAGEAGADGGGLYREFLLYAMGNFSDLSNLIFGHPNSCFLRHCQMAYAATNTSYLANSVHYQFLK